MTAEHRLLVELAAARGEIHKLRRSRDSLRRSRDMWKKECRALRWGLRHG